MQAVTAGWPLDRLTTAWARTGWAGLDQHATKGVRAILRTLSDLLPARSAQGRITAHQIATAACYSERWTRDALKFLERVGIITWTRGGILAGRPIPSIIRVNKAAIAALINRGRRAANTRARQHADATAKRINETIRSRRRTTINPGRATPDKSKPLATTAEVATTLPPYGECASPHQGGAGHPQDVDIRTHMRTFRQRLQEARHGMGRT